MTQRYTLLIYILHVCSELAFGEACLLQSPIFEAFVKFMRMQTVSINVSYSSKIQGDPKINCFF